ncbi:hypothetical protein [Brevibacillus migulae]|uniref:hypothetical protein n=1 Tax=Brevibacillus migulae TaxID=1644114 RepID=UPI00106DEACB|nr:hypothetical protein [Brevibacillus migulae]
MMLTYVGYHGNELEIINDACESEKHHKSTGDTHWYGDGKYFFEDSPVGNGLDHAHAWNYKEQKKDEERVLQSTKHLLMSSSLDCLI